MTPKPQAPTPGAILPCPFCGSLPWVRETYKGTLAECSNNACPCSYYVMLVDKWNTRANDQAIADAVREAKTVDVEVGAKAVKGVFDMSLVGPDNGFKSEDVAKACAEAWGLIAKEKQ